MESANSSFTEQEKSPSQENVTHPQSEKSDVESSKDFEEIMEDISSVRNATAEFLQYETGYINRFQDKLSDTETEKSKDSSVTTTVDSELPEMTLGTLPKDTKDNEYSTPKHSDLSEQHHDDSVSDSRLIDFDQADSYFKKSEGEGEVDALENQQLSPKQDIFAIVDENKVVDVHSNDDISVTSEESSFIPKKGESSPILYSDADKNMPKKPVIECKSNEATDIATNSQSLSKFTSEVGLNKDQEPEILQGDGLHVKENNEIDLSDNEDFVPDPIPKDYPEIGAIEGKEFLAAIGLDTWFHPDMLNPNIESLVYWRDPKKSGIVFASILVILLSLTSFSLISVVAHTSLIALLAALSFRIYKSVLQAVQKTSEGHPFKEYLEIDLTINQEKAQEISGVAVSYVNNALNKFRRLFLVEDLIDSIKFGILLWCLTYVGAWFNGLSLLIIAFVGLFTLPKVYENNKVQIDANVDIVRSKINEITEKIKSGLPMGKKTEEAKDKSE